ncbi:hypothetical protein F5882DRAFT_385378 [Hyaloscypha sp. PMI_1271]|nr:hypothetical protein F5882DRAFT_385378 [Hyaloscypha sp. PMI_1271]
MQFLAGVLLFCPFISALVFEAPEPTAARNAINPRPEIRNPQPTEGPNVHELLKRSASIPLTQVMGPDTICGYEFGSSDYDLGICGKNKCGFATALGQEGQIYCFGSTTSFERPAYWSTCLDGLSATSCVGNPACRDNSEVILWYTFPFI